MFRWDFLCYIYLLLKRFIKFPFNKYIYIPYQQFNVNTSKENCFSSADIFNTQTDHEKVVDDKFDTGCLLLLYKIWHCGRLKSGKLIVCSRRFSWHVKYRKNVIKNIGKRWIFWTKKH